MMRWKILPKSANPCRLLTRVSVGLLSWFGLFVCVQAAAQTVESPGVGASDGQSVYEARALIEADATVVLSSEIAGRIIDMPFREGDTFQKGDSLVRFDCREFEGRLAVAKASLKAARLTLDNQKRREALDAAGALEVGLAEAEVERAEGQVAIARFPVERCDIRAPFDGRIVEKAARQFETVKIGAPLMSILDDRRLELKIVVPSAWLAWLKTGQPFRLHVDETGGVVHGKVGRIGAAIDAVSQSLPVYARLEQDENDAQVLISGMSGVVTFSRDPVN